MDVSQIEIEIIEKHNLSTPQVRVYKYLGMPCVHITDDNYGVYKLAVEHNPNGKPSQYNVSYECYGGGIDIDVDHEIKYLTIVRDVLAYIKGLAK